MDSSLPLGIEDLTDQLELISNVTLDDWLDTDPSGLRLYVMYLHISAWEARINVIKGNLMNRVGDKFIEADR